MKFYGLYWLYVSRLAHKDSSGVFSQIYFHLEIQRLHINLFSRKKMKTLYNYGDTY